MKQQPKTRNHDRSDENTQMSISVPKSLKSRIQAAADAQDRSISSYIRVLLSDLLAEEAADKYHPRVAEDSPSYASKKRPRRDQNGTDGP